MKKILLGAFLATCCFAALAQTPNPKYDEALAKSLGGDEYGMKMYVLAILKTGTSNMEKSPARDSLFAGHMANINRLVEQKKLFIAGPLQTNPSNYRGIFIFDVKTIEEAKALVATDPTVKAKIFDVDFFQWYGSAALPEYLKSHEKIEKIKH